MGNCGKTTKIRENDKRRLNALPILCFALFVLEGCTIFGHDGPSIDAVRSGATSAEGSYSLVELSAQANAVIEATPETVLEGLDNASSSAPVDVIGVGDGLAVTIFDSGSGALFGGGISEGKDSKDSAGNSIPKLYVDTLGNITIPYVGNVHVASLTNSAAAEAIRKALLGKTINPQVIVNIADNVTNSVTVVGEVRNPGRYALTNGSNHILDVMAVAGGPTKQPADLRVEIVRGKTTASVTLADLFNDDSQNIRLAPRDQLRFFYEPRKFSTFGAVVRPSQISIEDNTLTLAGALSKAGWLDPGSANASSVLLFRFERPQVAQALSVKAPASSKGVPIIYHIDMRDPEEVFVANHFLVKSDDLIYVPRADIAEIQQFLNLVNTASSVAYNIRVTAAIVK